MPDELLPIHLAANPAAETVAPKNVIEQAIEVFARVAVSPFTASTKAFSRGFSTATAKKRFLQHWN